MTKRQILVELVKKEAKKLRGKLKKQEIKNLNFDSLDGNHTDNCIYGQIAGDCTNKRANSLIIDCCEKVYNTRDTNDLIEECKLNGKPTVVSSYRLHNYISPIELYIYKNRTNLKANNKKLIDYLKGLTNKLDIS